MLCQNQHIQGCRNAKCKYKKQADRNRGASPFLLFPITRTCLLLYLVRVMAVAVTISGGDHCDGGGGGDDGDDGIGSVYGKKGKWQSTNKAGKEREREGECRPNEDMEGGRCRRKESSVTSSCLLSKGRSNEAEG